MESDERIKEAVLNTQIVRAPKQSLATFGATNIHYYLVAEAACTELIKSTDTVIREGQVVAERPRIVTPYYLSRVQGFSAEAKKYFDMVAQTHSADSPGIFYAYRNEPKELNVVSDPLAAVLAKLNAEVDKNGNPLTSIIKGEDTLWDVSILKFIYELTERSVQDNVKQFNQKGLLRMDPSGLPGDARMRIEALFRLVEKGEMEPADLKTELDRWNVFEEYQDRFFAFFKKKG